MFVERLERDWVVKLSVRFARVVQRDEVVWCQRFVRDGVGIIMLPCSFVRGDTRAYKGKHALQPRNDVHKIEYMPCAISVSSTDRMAEWLETQCAAVKRCPCARMRGLLFSIAEKASVRSSERDYRETYAL